ncbi:D-2-hydroxyacid dehydrogenase [Halocalculus aciditolerans]|uniref:Phosphoglycerate dehydrogenase n=1 Tax=Halocalculus aciditolerans TaxID=1383812 RepID=A0A830FM02_9EURY|nr:D-2-hydroxyacid dehydrogenase [Halocalculus aciditolerans]GGL68954.1 phosphoglycerate dehydrogenase [Halocalculus aciditolerans]
MNIEHLGVHDSISAVFPPERLVDALASVDPNVSIVRDGEYDDIDAVVTFAHDDAYFGQVEWVHCARAGYDDFPVERFEETGTILTNSSGIHGASVGETAVGMMLSLARCLHVARDAQNRGEWSRPEWDRPFTLFDQRVTVVGLGTLGQGIARRADGLGMRVSGVRRTPARPPHVREVYTPVDLHDAIADAKFVALTTPLTEETAHMFGAEEFDVMRDDAYLVNVARGGVVDQDALVDALESGDIAGAGLDVFEEEPLPESSPLWEMDDVVVTPHVGAADRNYYQDIAALVRQNVLHASADEEFVNRVA